MKQLTHSLCGDKNLVPFYFVVKRNCAKSEKVYKRFVKLCLIAFLLGFICSKMPWNPKNDPFLFKKLFMNTALMQQEMPFVPCPYLTLTSKIVFFERYHIQVFFIAELPEILFWRTSQTFQLLKSSENAKSGHLDLARNKNLFLKTILDKSF